MTNDERENLERTLELKQNEFTEVLTLKNIVTALDTVASKACDTSIVGPLGLEVSWSPRASLSLKQRDGGRLMSQVPSAVKSQLLAELHTELTDTITTFICNRARAAQDQYDTALAAALNVTVTTNTERALRKVNVRGSAAPDADDTVNAEQIQPYAVSKLDTSTYEPGEDFF